MRLQARRGDALARRVGRGVLLCLLALAPLAFSRRTLEAFEFPKVLLLTATAVVLAAGALALAFERALAGGPRALRPALWGMVRGDPLAWGALLYLASAALATSASLSPRTSFWGAPESFFGLVTVAAYVVVYFAVGVLCAAPVHARALLLASVAGATGAGLYGLAQFAGLDPVAWTRTHEFLGLARAFGTMGNPNFLGALMAMSLPLSLALALRFWRRRKPGRAVLLAAAAAVALGALGVSLSRGAWLAGAAGLGVWALGQLRLAERPEARRRLVFGAAATALLLGLAVARLPRAREVTGAMLARLELNLSPAARERPVGALALEQDPRLALWRAAWAMFRERPLTGVGLDAFQLAFQRHRELAVWEVEGQRTPGKAHNEVLHTLATQGLPGAAALALMAAGAVIALRRALRREPDERELLVGIAAALAAFATQVQFSFTVAGCGTLAVGLLGLLAALGRRRPAATATPPPLAPTAARTLALSLGQALIAVLGAAALWLLVARPLRADFAARRGVVAGARLPGGAVPECAQAARLDPGRDLYWTQLGAARYELARTLPDATARAAQLVEARADFERALALVPVNGYTQGGLGRVLIELARLTPPRATPAEAWAAFERAIALDPKNPYWPVEAGRYALDAQEPERARAWARRSLELHPRYGPAACLLHNVALNEVLPLLGTVDPESLRAAFDPIATGLRDAATHLRWYEEHGLRSVCASQAAAALVAAQRLPEARDVAELATHVDPNFADAHYNLGRIYERLGDARAGSEYRQALRLRPGHPEAQRALAALAPR